MDDMQPSRQVFRNSQLERADGPGLNPTTNPTMGEIIATRFSRRGFLQGLDGGDRDLRHGQPASRCCQRARPAPQTRVAGSVFDFPEVDGRRGRGPPRRRGL